MVLNKLFMLTSKLIFYNNGFKIASKQLFFLLILLFIIPFLRPVGPHQNRELVR